MEATALDVIIIGHLLQQLIAMPKLRVWIFYSLQWPCLLCSVYYSYCCRVFVTVWLLLPNNFSLLSQITTSVITH